MNTLVEWFRSTKKERERVAAGGIKIHTSDSGGRFVKAGDVLETESAKAHFRAMSDLMGVEKNGSNGNGHNSGDKK